jgi:hypothetical protein
MTLAVMVSMFTAFKSMAVAFIATGFSSLSKTDPGKGNTADESGYGSGHEMSLTGYQIELSCVDESCVRTVCS